MIGSTRPSTTFFQNSWIKGTICNCIHNWYFEKTMLQSFKCIWRYKLLNLKFSFPWLKSGTILGYLLVNIADLRTLPYYFEVKNQSLWIKKTAFMSLEIVANNHFNKTKSSNSTLNNWKSKNSKTWIRNRSYNLTLFKKLKNNDIKRLC